VATLLHHLARNPSALAFLLHITKLDGWCKKHWRSEPLARLTRVLCLPASAQVPTDLDGPIAKRLASIVVPGQAGPVVDLDALLMMLVNEYNLGQCPRAAMLFPRRLTDGSLFNIFNVLGHSPHVDALTDGRAASIINATSPPGSPPRTRRLGDPPVGSGGTVFASGGYVPPRTPSRPGSALVPTNSARLVSPNPSASITTPPMGGGTGRGLPGAQGVPVPGLVPSGVGPAVSHHLNTTTTAGPMLGPGGVTVGSTQFPHHMHHLAQGLAGPVELASDGNMRYVRPATTSSRSAR
jgi:hypothetical protein